MIKTLSWWVLGVIVVDDDAVLAVCHLKGMVDEIRG
jgi:hypothetical protein